MLSKQRLEHELELDNGPRELIELISQYRALIIRLNDRTFESNYRYWYAVQRFADLQRELGVKLDPRDYGLPSGEEPSDIEWGDGLSEIEAHWDDFFFEANQWMMGGFLNETRPYREAILARVEEVNEEYLYAITGRPRRFKFESSIEPFMDRSTVDSVEIRALIWAGEIRSVFELTYSVPVTLPAGGVDIRNEQAFLTVSGDRYVVDVVARAAMDTNQFEVITHQAGSHLLLLIGDVWSYAATPIACMRPMDWPGILEASIALLSRLPDAISKIAPIIQSRVLEYIEQARREREWTFP